MLSTQVLISFVIGGLFIALQTFVGERVPPKWRRIVLTIPSTLALGLLFIAITKTTADVAEAALIVPAALGPDYLFMAIVALLIHRGLLLSLTAGYAVWAIGAYFILTFPPETYAISALYGIPLIILGYLSLRHIKEVPKLKAFPITPFTTFVRSLIGGAIIALVVILSNTLGNDWGGLFAAFPAAFTSTIIIYYHMQGPDKIPAINKSMFFPGSLSFIIYGWVAGITFPLWGMWWGTLAAYAASFSFFLAYNKLLK